MRLWRTIAVVMLFAVLPAFGQDEAPPTPAPLPTFHAPVAGGDASATDSAASDDSGATDDTAAPSTPPPAKPAVPLVTTPQPVTLTALVADGGQSIVQGLVWRVFGTKPDASGHLVLAAKSDAAVANVSLAPGDYVVHVAYGRAQASDTITVKEGQNDKSIVLNAGGLRLNAAIVGDIAIPINLLHFDIFTPGQNDADRVVVAQDLSPNDVITLNAGIYHIVSYFGDVNAVVRADLKVDPGQLTDATLYHHAAQVSFKLVSETGGEAIADVDWTVKATDGSTVFTNTGTFPSTVLQEGDYTVLAKRGDKVFNRDFEIQPGQPKEVEVLTTVY